MKIAENLLQDPEDSGSVSTIPICMPGTPCPGTGLRCCRAGFTVPPLGHWYSCTDAMETISLPKTVVRNESGVEVEIKKLRLSPVELNVDLEFLTVLGDTQCMLDVPCAREEIAALRICDTVVPLPNP